MSATDQLVTETNFIRDGLAVRVDHTLLLWYALNPPTKAQRAVLEGLGYEPEDLTTRFFENPAEPGGLRLLSFWADADVPVYRHKATGMLVPFFLNGHMSHDLTSKSVEEMGKAIERPLPRAAWEFLVSECEYAGPIGHAPHLEVLRDIIRAVPAGDQLVIIAANEAAPGRPPHPRHVELNKRIEQLTREFSRIRVVRPGDFITGPADAVDVNHFSRMVYVRMYAAVASAWSNPTATSSNALLC